MRRFNFGDVLVGSAGIGMILLWIFSVVASLAVPVVVIWAIIKLVKHFTGA